MCYCRYSHGVLCGVIHQLIHSLESWEPDFSRQELAHRILMSYCEKEKLEEAIALVQLLMDRNVLDLAYKTVYRLVSVLENTKYMTENAEVNIP